MGKNQSASNLTNIIKQDANGGIAFMSGSTMLMALSNTGQMSGSAPVVSAATASSADNLLVRNTLTAQTLVVQTITSSVDFVTGSTRFGTLLANTHTFTGSMNLTGSLTVVTTGTELQVNATGVNLGNALTDSHVISGSLRINPNTLVVSSSGNVGIGLINPSYRLHVSGAFSSNPGLYVYGTTYGMVGVDRGTSASSAGINYYTTGSQRWFTGIYENTNNFGFYNAGNVNFPLVIQYSDGNIGVGITSPYTKLQIQGGHASIQSNSTASTDGAGDTRNAGFGFRHASADLISALINTTAVADWGLNLHFNTRQFNATMPATPAMTITAGQNIGIGKTDPEGPLHINGAIGAGYIGMAITNFSNTIGTTAGIDFGSDASTCYNGAGNGQIAVTNIGGTGGGQSAEMNLKVWTGSALVTGIKINNTGRVSFPTATAQNYGLSNATAVTINSGSGTIASCSITSVGKPILINLTGDINPVGGPSWCYLYIYRNGSPIGKLIIAESPGASTNIPFALSTIDIPGAGTHTYTGYTTIGGANPIQFGETGNSQAPTILAIDFLIVPRLEP
jgi:hypothetical protein